MKKDYRINQRVIATIVLEDKGQDFTELDVLENGVILGNSPMFSNGRLTMIGVGALDGARYFTFSEIRKAGIKQSFITLFVYIKDTANKKEPLPWNAQTLKYRIWNIKKADEPDRFIRTN